MITNDLYASGKSHNSTELVNKIIRSLPKTYQSKVVAILEARELSKFPLEELTYPWDYDKRSWQRWKGGQEEEDDCLQIF